MQPYGSAKVLETRRWRAFKLLKDRFLLNRAAQLIGCAANSVMRWRDALAHGGGRSSTSSPPPRRWPFCPHPSRETLPAVSSKWVVGW